MVLPYTGPPIHALNLAQSAEWEHLERLRRFQRAWEAYHGQHPKPLTVRKGQPDDNVIVNKARTIVNKGVSFLFGADLTFSLDGDPAKQSPEEAWLQQVWARNRQATTLQKLAMNGGVCGHAFVKIVPGRAPAEPPRLIVLDPATVTPVWDPDDIETVVRYIIQYPALDPATGRPILKRQTIAEDGGRWAILDEEGAPDGGGWRAVGEAIWPFPWAPVLDCQNLPVPNEFWGESDLEEDLLDLNQARNRVLSNTNRIIRFHAHPKTIVKGMAAKLLDVSIDNVIGLPSPEADMKNLEMQSDLGSSLEFDRRVDEALHEVARIPPIATGKLEDVGQLSGLALAILYQPLIEKTETKRKTYGDMLAELNRRLLLLGGHGERVVATHWPPLLPSDPLAERQALQIDHELGASSHTILTTLGYDAEEEGKLKEDEQAAAAEQFGKAFDAGKVFPPGQGGRGQG